MNNLKLGTFFMNFMGWYIIGMGLLMVFVTEIMFISDFGVYTGQTYEQYYATNLRRDLRMADYIRRIPMAIARVSFSDVTDDTLHEASSIVSESIETWFSEN